MTRNWVKVWVFFWQYAGCLRRNWGVLHRFGLLCSSQILGQLQYLFYCTQKYWRLIFSLIFLISLTKNHLDPHDVENTGVSWWIKFLGSQLDTACTVMTCLRVKCCCDVCFFYSFLLGWRWTGLHWSVSTHTVPCYCMFTPVVLFLYFLNKDNLTE